MPVPADLRPTFKKGRVYDLVSEAGIDVSDWQNVRGGKGRAAANPKYCYEWAFVQPNSVVVLNLWYEELEEINGVVFERRSLRSLTQHTSGAANQARSRRVRAMEHAISTAFHMGLPVRVIICDGPRRAVADPRSVASRVVARRLDDEVWAITAYDATTGYYVATRGGLAQSVSNIDEMDLDLQRQVWRSMRDSSDDRQRRLAAARTIPFRVATQGFAYQRNADVIAHVLLRAAGCCESCGLNAPFMRKSNGAPYLEVHHKVQLANGGEDTIANAVAVCPNCHRLKHFG